MSYSNNMNYNPTPLPLSAGTGMSHSQGHQALNPNAGYLASRRQSAPAQTQTMDGSALDTSAAMLDAAILDLTRRRFSMASGALGLQGQSSLGSASGLNPVYPQTPSAHSLAARQQQLQQQQAELEQRQHDLECQRQQLLSGIDSAMHSVPPPPQTAPPNPSRPGAERKWWVCQVCNSKAFSSREEAMAHEVTCGSTMQGGPVALPTHSHHPPSAPNHSHSHGYNPSMSSMGVMRSNSLPNTMRQDKPPMTAHPGMSTGMGQMGMDDMPPTMASSTGPFAMLQNPLPLAMPSDKDWLTPLHCFVRRCCVQVFCATAHDVATPSKGKRKPIQVGQVGIRCPHCQNSRQAERGSVYYPTTISSIYNATMNLLQRHLHSCSAVPESVMRRYSELKADDARSGTSKKYWVESALSLGLVDTASGIRFSALRPPPLPRLSRQQQTQPRRNSNDFFSTKSNALEPVAVDEEVEVPPEMTPNTIDRDDISVNTLGGVKEAGGEAGPLVSIEDKPYATGFSYLLLAQMQPCVFTEADRLGKRKGLPAGFAGLACRHCFGGYGSGRFFPSSIKTLSDTSKTLNVLHNHMMRCRKCPQDVRDNLEKLRQDHDEERAKMKFGSQKAFFAKIWTRLHEPNQSAGNAAPMNMMHPAAQPNQGMKRKDMGVDMATPEDMGHSQQMMSQHNPYSVHTGGPPPQTHGAPAVIGGDMMGPPHTAGPALIGGLDVLSKQASGLMPASKRIRNM